MTTFSRGLFDFSDYSRVEKGIVAALLAAITMSLVVLVSLSAVQYPGQLSPAIAITGPNGTADSLPTEFLQGEPQEINVTALGGATAGAFTVRIALIPQNATGNETFHAVPQSTPLRMDAFGEYRVSIILGSSETWTQRFSISIGLAGKFYLRFELLDEGAAVVARNSLPVVVT